MKPRPAPSDFVRASGNQLTLGARPIRLMGVKFPAYGWARSGYTRQDILQARNFRAADYRRVAALGMNVVRLNLSYLLLSGARLAFANASQKTATGGDWNRVTCRLFDF